MDRRMMIREIVRMLRDAPMEALVFVYYFLLAG